MTEIYFVQKSYLKEAIVTFSFKKKVDWLEEGLSILSWKYNKVGETEKLDFDEIYNDYKICDYKNRYRSINVGDMIFDGSDENTSKTVTGRLQRLPYNTRKICRNHTL